MKSFSRSVAAMLLVLAGAGALPRAGEAGAQAACTACTEWFDVPGEATGFLKGYLGLCARCQAGDCAEGAARMRKARAELDDERRAVRLLPDGDSNKDRRVRVLLAKLEFYDRAWAALLKTCPEAGDLEGTEADELPRHRARAAEASRLASGTAELAAEAAGRSRLHRDLVALGAVLAAEELGPAVAWDAEAMRVQGELGRMRAELAQVLGETAREWELLAREEERTAAGEGPPEGIAPPGDYRTRWVAPDQAPPPPPATASVPERHGIEALALRRRILANLKACRIALGRYRRAGRAGDGASVDLQAQALEEAAERARSAAEEAEGTSKLFERESDSTTRAVGATLLGDRGQWEAAFADLQPRLEASGAAGTPGASLAAVVPDAARRAGLVRRAKGLALDYLAGELAFRPRSGADKARVDGLGSRERLYLELVVSLGRRIRRRIAGTGIELVPAGSMPRSWWAVRTGRPFAPVEALSLVGTRSPVLLPGTYEVHVSQDGEDLLAAVPRTVVVSTAVAVKAGAVTRVALAGELAPEVGNGIGAPAAWYALRVDGPRPVVVAGRSDGTLAPLYLPTGRYEVLWAASPEAAGQPVRVAGPVEVRTGSRARVVVASGVRIDLGAGLPPPGPAGGFTAVRAGEPLEAKLVWSSHAGTIPLPPGRYDLYMSQDAEHTEHPTPVAAGVEVAEGRVSAVAVDAGLELAGGEAGGWWGVTLPGMPPETRLAWTREGTVLALAPGRYDVVRAAGGAAGGEAKRFAIDVEVRPGALTRVDGAGAPGGDEP